MSANLICTKCEESLQKNEKSYDCNKCKKSYSIRNGFVDFLGEDVNIYAGETTAHEIQKFLQDSSNLGYNKALELFLDRNPRLAAYVTDVRRADWVFHCLGENYKKCLDIGSGYGNISEILSKIFREVYSLEAVEERIKFQIKRFENSNIKNIFCVRQNGIKIPFPDNYFDLVVCNGVLEWVGMFNLEGDPRDTQIQFLKEIRRVLSNSGCLYIGIENRFGLQNFLGYKDHSGYPFTSLMPRRLANFLVKRFGKVGGIYADSTKIQNQRKGYYTYTYSNKGYVSLFKEAGFKTESYWTFISYNQPYFSGRLDDKIGLNGCIKYFKNSFSEKNLPLKYKFAIKVGSLFDKHTQSLLTNYFCPSFLFYCYKNENAQSLEKFILKKTNMKNFVLISGWDKIKYILYNSQGKPTKVAIVKRFGNEMPKSIPSKDKTKPEISNFTERVWLENWLEGEILNPLKVEQTELALIWLFDFQNNSKKEKISQHDISLEANKLRDFILKIPKLDTSKHRKWIDNYENYLSSINLTKTAQHGDFWYGNILFNGDNKKITVIDWENFEENTNPLFDYVFFIINAMQLPTNPRKTFKDNYHKSGPFLPILEKLQPLVVKHFKFEPNLEILIPGVLIYFLSRKYLEEGAHGETILTYLKLIAEIA